MFKCTPRAPFLQDMNTLHALAALALVLLPACGGAIEGDSPEADDGIVTVVTRYYPPARTASTPAPSDEASPMDGDDVAPAPAPAPSPATRDDEVAPAPEPEQPEASPESPAAAPDAPAPSPEYSNDEPEVDAEPAPAPVPVELGQLCTDDEQCGSFYCSPVGGMMARDVPLGTCQRMPPVNAAHVCTWNDGVCQ